MEFKQKVGPVVIALLYIRRWVGHCNGCVKFEFNDITTLYVNDESECKIFCWYIL